MGVIRTNANDLAGLGVNLLAFIDLPLFSLAGPKLDRELGETEEWDFDRTRATAVRERPGKARNFSQRLVALFVAALKNYSNLLTNL
jgi:hypothetical protein